MPSEIDPDVLPDLIKVAKEQLVTQAANGSRKNVYAKETSGGNEWTVSAWAKFCEETRSKLEYYKVPEEEIGQAIQEATEKVSLVDDTISYKD